MNYRLDENRSPAELFSYGDAVRIYEFLGSKLTTVDEKCGAMFRVWAPNALSVSVTGDFNGWNNESNFMNKTDNGIWELFIEGIAENSLYKYCIETSQNEKILKSDPYANLFETSPNKASVVCNLDTYNWNDSAWLEKRSKIDKLKEPMNIYEVHLDSWKKNPDSSRLSYPQLADELIPYLKEMKYTHLQFMPIAEYPYDGSWGYQTTGYFAPTSRFGSPTELMELIDRLHNENIGVILDWVPSNFPKDDFALARFDGGCLYENENPLLGERPSWGTCIFDFGKPEVIGFLISSAMFWLDKFHFDGLRVGALSSMLYLDYEKKEGEWLPNKFGGKENLEVIDFLKRLNTAVHLHYPDVIMFAEENTAWPKLTRSVENGGLGFDYKWNMGWMNDMLNYMALNPPWRPFNHDNLTFSFFYAFAEHFVLPLSHDEVSHGKSSLINKMPNDYDEKFAGVRALITYMYAHPGKKLIFMGTEIGQFDEWDSSSEIQWNLLEYEKHQKLKYFFTKINEFYLANKPLYELDAIWRGFDWIHHDDYLNSVIAFKRNDSEGNEIVAVCNFQPVKRENYCIGVPKYGIYDEIFNSDDVEFGGTGVTNGKQIVPEVMKIHGYNQGLSLTLPPLGVIYLKCVEKLEMPEKEAT